MCNVGHLGGDGAERNWKDEGMFVYNGEILTEMNLGLHCCCLTEVIGAGDGALHATPLQIAVSGAEDLTLCLSQYNHRQIIMDGGVKDEAIDLGQDAHAGFCRWKPPN